MSRIIKTIEIEGQQGVALFDTGATLTYVVKKFLKDVPLRSVLRPYKVAIGGREIEVKEFCAIRGKIEGLGFDTEATPVDKIGKADGKEIDILIGALTMEQWGIKLDPKNGSLDLTFLKERIFTEFCILIFDF